MSNSFYTHGAFPSTGSAATSASMRAELDLISAGFDKMPTLSGNANLFVVINSTGTGLTQTSTLPSATFTDTLFTIQDDGDNTRKFQFNASTVTPGATRIYSVPDANTTLVGTDTTQTLTNKTLTAPVISSIVNTGSLSLPTSTDTLVGRATTDTLTNKTLTSPVIATIVNTGTLTLPTSTDTLVGRATTDTLTNKTLTSPVIGTIVNTGTLTLPTSTDTLVGRTTTDTLTNKTLTSPVIGTIVNTGTLTLPTSTDTLVGRATTDTLTNKTLTSPVIGTIVNTGTLTLPTSTDTLVGRATTDTLTNKTLGAFTISGTVSGGGNQINNVIIGASTPLAGSFTTLSTTGLASLPSTGRSAAAALTVTNPAFLYGVASTYTDTASSGVIAAMAPFYSISGPTLSTSNVTTYTNAATLYIANAPTAGGSATITNPYAVYVAAGAAYFGGAVTFAGSASLAGLTVTSLTNSGLTTGRVVYTTTGGLETSSANLTFNGTTLTANTIGAFTLSGTVAGGGNQINNVIIGTSTPLAGAFTTLSASTSITNTGLTSGRVVYSTTGGLETDSAGLTFDGTNFGIGTSSPAALLDINGSSGWAGGTTGNVANIKGANATVTQGGNLRVLASTAFGVDIGGSMALGGQYTSGFYLDFAQIAGRKENATDNNTAGYLAFATRANGGNTTERMRIDSSGNVGIGTTSPSSYGKLTVNDTAASSVYVRSSSTNFAGLILDNTNSASKWQIGVEGGTYNTAGLLNIGISGVGPALVIDTSGNVGIGTNSPSAKLNVVGGRTFLSANNETYSLGVTYNSTGGQYYIGATNSATPDLVFSNVGGAERARITYAGELLVGTTSTSATSGAGFKFLVNGTVPACVATYSTNANSAYLMYSTGAGAYRFFVAWDGTINATSIVITAISDQRLKENIRDIDTGLDAIIALKPRRFDWKEGKGQDKKNVAGFIAQEFEEVFPESVGISKAGEDGIEYKNINHETLIPTLVKAIQEQQALITSLTARIEALER